jgi:hypothetical protein
MHLPMKIFAANMIDSRLVLYSCGKSNAVQGSALAIRRALYTIYLKCRP